MKVLEPTLCLFAEDGGLRFPDLGVEVPRARCKALEIAAEALRCSEQLRRTALRAVLATISPGSTDAQLTRQMQVVEGLGRVVEFIEESRIDSLEERAFDELRNLELYEELKAFLDRVVKFLRDSVRKVRGREDPPEFKKLVDRALESEPWPEPMTWKGTEAAQLDVRAWLLQLDDPDERRLSRVKTSEFALELVGRVSGTSAKAVLDGNTLARKVRAVEAEQIELASEILRRLPRNVR